MKSKLTRSAMEYSLNVADRINDSAEGINNYPPIYADAQKVIRILMDHRVIKSEYPEDGYLKIWDAALEITELLK